MDTKQLQKAIKNIETNGAKRVQQIQEAAVGSLEQVAEFGNVTYMNQLYLACRKGERDALARWAFAFGQLKPNLKKDTKAAMPLAFDADKCSDMPGAAATCWEQYQREATSVEKLFDESKAVDTLIQKLLADAKKFKHPEKAAALGATLRAAMDAFRAEAEQEPNESTEV